MPPMLQYYYDLMSQPSRALYIFFKLTKIPFEPRLVALRNKEHLTDEFKLSFNRFQKVPFIHHGDFKLAESVAILGYLNREYKDLIPDHWYPSNNQAQAKVDEYLAWHHINTRMPCALCVRHNWMIPLMTQTPPDKEQADKRQSDMETSLNQIEELWLSQGHKYIVGDTVSVADIFAACELEQVKLTGYDVTNGRPILKAWLERVRAYCNPVYDEAHSIINKIASKSKEKS